jgi:RecJ-like exonuclease
VTCPVCRYHSGDLTVAQQCCPMVHTYQPEAWEFPSSAYSLDGPDAKPLNRCPFCLDGTVDGTDICPTCWGSGKAD